MRQDDGITQHEASLVTYSAGDLVSVTEPTGKTTTAGTDAVDRVMAITDPRQPDPPRL